MPVDLGPDDLVLCSGTLYQRGFCAIVEAAAAGGYRAITLWPSDVAHARSEGLSDADMRRLLADNGLVVADLDALLTWSPEVMPKPGEAVVGLASEDDFYAIADTLGGRSLNAVMGFGDSLDLDCAADDLAALCERAATHDLFVTIEFLPWTGIRDAGVALDLVERSGRSDATVLVDTWHWFRSGGDLESLRRLPAARIGSTQFNDCPATAQGHPAVECMSARLLPGEGDIPLAEVVRTLDAAGSRSPIGVEVFNARHAAMTPAEIGRKTAEAARRMLADARAA